MYFKYFFAYTDETTTFHKLCQYSAHFIYDNKPTMFD